MVLDAFYCGMMVLIPSQIMQDTCELPHIGLNVVGELSATMDQNMGTAGPLSLALTMPDTNQTLYPSGGDGLGRTIPNGGGNVDDLQVTGGSDLMMPHAIGVGMGLNTVSGFLQVELFRDVCMALLVKNNSI